MVCYRFATFSILCALATACSPAADTKPQAGTMGIQARERIAMAAEASGDNQLALSMYAAASADAPKDVQAQLRYADSLIRAGQVEPARDLLTRGLATASEPLAIRRGLAALDVLTDHIDQAITELDKVLAARPADLGALVDKAVALDLLGRHDEAQRLYAQALTIAPNDPAIANDLALSLALQGKLTEARAVVLPFRDVTNVPERLKVTLRILSGRDTETGDDRIRQMAVSLASAGRANPSVARPVQ